MCIRDSNNSDSNVYIASGLYPVDVRNELIYNNCVDECVENNRVEDNNHIVVIEGINGCVGNVLLDSGAQVSLINEKRRLEIHKLFVNKHLYQ